ncbi:P-loop containing nucleoside triphosphate hydrolase protein [Trichoderma chlorosporum]
MAQRTLMGCQFGNNITITQGDTHYNLPYRPPPSGEESAYVIPYPRNEDIVCRPDLVKQLDQLLPRGSKFHSAALWGLGGSGKTQIALDYAYQRCDDPRCSVFWVHADSKATFIHDYKAIAHKICIEQDADGEHLLRSVRSGIEALPSWVLILDNVDNLPLFGVGESMETDKDELNTYIPNGPRGTVLWTSRDANIVGTLVGPQRGVEVTSMGTRNKEIGANERDDAMKLLKELEWLPLAISQAGAYMRRMRITTTKYLCLLGQSKLRWETLKSTEFDRHRRPGIPNSVLDTWTVSMERIQSENGIAHQILHIIAYLDNQNLSEELMILCGKYSHGDTNRPVKELEVLSAISRLQEFSFLRMRQIEEGDPSYEMHKLVQEAARYRLNIQDPQTTSTQDTTIQKEADVKAYYTGIALRILLELFPTSSPESWPQCEKYLAHAIGLSDWAEISQREADISELLSKVSGYLYDQGRWREKAPVDQRAIDLRRKVLGERHPQTLESLASLAAAYHYQGQHEKAKICYNEVWKSRGQTLGERHPDTLRAMSLLGNVYQSHGEYKEAEDLYEKALPLQREVLGERHMHTIHSLASLSAVYHYQGYYAKAKPLKIEALILQREILGEKHPLTLWNIGSLAATYQCLGQYKEARTLYEETLDLRQQTLGKHHPDTLRSITQLGSIYHDLHNYKMAETLAKKALDLETKILGEKHPYTLQSMHNLAIARRSRGRKKEAISLMQHVQPYPVQQRYDRKGCLKPLLEIRPVGHPCGKKATKNMRHGLLWIGISSI